VGARRRDILGQFLLESVVMSSLGGGLGIAVGVGGAKTLSLFFTYLPTQVSPWAVLMAFGFSAAVGIFFGVYPARRAALLDPIQALRYE
jgi:putative ABC transport system permease protein